MGAIRWTGKGLKLVGELLAAEEVEAWVQEKGKDYLKRQLQGLFLKWLFGRNRATSRVFSDISKSIDSDTFRSALAAALETLAGFIESWGEYVQKQKIPGVHYTRSSSDCQIAFSSCPVLISQTGKCDRDLSRICRLLLNRRK